MSDALLRSLPGRLLRAASLFALLAVASCDRGNLAPLPFDGARRLELRSVGEGKAPSDAEVHELVEALYAAYGGDERWKDRCFVSVEDVSVAYTGDVMSNRAVKTVWCRPDDTFRSVERFRSGDSQRLMSKAGKFLALRSLDLTPVRSGNEVLLDYEYEVLRLPASMRREGVRITAGAPVQRDGATLVPLTVQDLLPPDLVVYVDPVGPVIRRVEAKVPVAAQITSGAASLDLAIEYRDFVREDGILVARRTDRFSGDERMSLADHVEIRSVDWIDDSVFDPARLPEVIAR